MISISKYERENRKKKQQILVKSTKYTRNMASVVHLCLALFILSGSYLSCVDAEYEQYFWLISDVHRYYKTSSVFFIFSRNNWSMEDYTMTHSLSRTFSEEGIFTLISNFAKLAERLHYYRKRISRPLIVVLLKSARDIADFNKSTRDIKKSCGIWLAIFHGHSSNPFCEYCSHPVENILSLQFDTSMLVVCCENPTLQEWWSVDGNRTEIGDFGSWTVNDRLKLRAVGGLSARRNDLHGTGLRVVIVPSSAVHDYGHRIGGLFGGVLRELQRAMNFTITATLREEAYGIYNSTTKNWSGAVGVLVRREADLAIADLTMLTSRLDAIDFTYPLLLSRNQLFIKQPDGARVQWSAYFETFALEIWVTIILLVIITALLLAFIKGKGGSISLLSLGIDNCLCVWGIYCQQGLFAFPTETPLRIAYLSIFVSALVISAEYSASLISYLTLSSPSLPFSTMVGFVNDGSYKLIVFQNSSDYDFLSSSNDPISVKMMKLMKPWQDLPRNMKSGWEQVCEQRVALYATDGEQRMMDIPCKVVAIDTGRVDFVAMALPKGSQYTDVINYHIERFKGNGILNRLKELYYTNEIPAGETSFDVVELIGVAPILSVLAGGIIFAFIILFCEKSYYSLKNHGRCWPRGIKSRKIHRRLNFPIKEQPSSENLRLPFRL